MSGTLLYRFMLWLVGLGAWIRPAPGDNPLRLIEEDLSRRYAAIRHDTPAVVAEFMEGRGTAALIVDTRSAAEYAVSHLAGAAHVDPGIAGEAFVEQLGSLLKGRHVVFYCAVGLRSSKVAMRLLPLLQAYDAKTVSNLSGGLFRWHNEGRPVVGAADDACATVHPFNAYWARFLKSRH